MKRPAMIHQRTALYQKMALVGVALGLANAAQAAPFGFAGTSARDAADQLTQKYGIHIVFKGAINPQTPVTFTLSDGDAAGARLQAVNAFANAVGADFQKTYVVSKADENTTNVPSEQIDTNAIVVFPSRTVPAEEAVRRIANVDNATVQFYGTIADNVTLSALNLSATSAARQVADQTHTKWKVFYAMTPRQQGHALAGKVIDRTSNGSPIIEEPYVYYKRQQDAASVPVAQTPPPTNPQATGQPQAVGPQTAGNPFYYGPTPYGDPNNPNSYPYGYSPYAGNNPYAQNVYPGGPYFDNSGGFNTGGGVFDTGGGLDVLNGGGFDGPIVFGGGY